MLVRIFENAILPIAICVGLPISVVWLYLRSRINETNHRSELIKLAIENNSQVDIAKLVEQLNGKQQARYLKFRLLRLLQAGCVLTGLGLGLMAYIMWMVFYAGLPGTYADDLQTIMYILLFVGISLIIAFVVSKKVMKRELEAEAEAAENEAKAKLEA